MRAEPRLYHPPVPELLAVVHAVPAYVSTLLVVGHNPSLRDTILMVAGDGVGSEIPQVQEKFPTAAIAELTWHGTWGQLGLRTALLTGLAVARGDRRRPS